MFINMAYLYLRMKIKEESKSTKMIWILSYMQGGVVEAQKDNLLDKLSKGKSEVEIAEELFSKTRNKFGEIAEEKRKVECYESSKKETVSHTFKYFIQNLKLYNGIKE